MHQNESSLTKPPLLTRREALCRLNRWSLAAGVSRTAGLSLITGCTTSIVANRQRDGLIAAVATTGMIADLVRQIGGSLVRVEQLIQAGVDPHLYKPIRDDVVAILASDVVFFNGLKLEGRMADLLSGNVAENRRHVALSDAMDKREWLGEPGLDAIDPHIWMDVSVWSRATTLVESQLIALRPDRAQEFAERADLLRARLDQLDRRGRAAMDSIPPSQRVLISSHDAFQYFGRRYGLQVEGVQGISTASEAGLSRIPELIALIQERRIPAVFKESSVAGRMIDAILEGAAARGIRLSVGPELYSDALGETGSGAETYEGMMIHNFRSVAESLGGRWE